MNQFYQQLIHSIDNNLYNYHIDNFDFHRFNKRPTRLKDYIINFLSMIGLINRSISLEKLAELYPHIQELNEVYGNLADQKSKDLLVLVFAYRMLGHRKVRLPLSTPKYWEDLRKVESLKQGDAFIDPKFQHFVLHKFNLRKIGFDITFYYSARGIMQDFIARQYEYSSGKRLIKVKEGDVVIDGGGCWGDTALYFAHEVKKTGRVFSFEFVASNVSIFNQNIQLNPDMSGRISLVQQPLWSEPGLPIYVLDNGPASRISFEKIDGATVLSTTTIDSLLTDNKIEVVNFLKLDVEGAELNVLKGAEKSIRLFKPTLAVALYHRVEDFYTIPQWISSLDLGYRFYIGHYTIHKEETILFAKIND